MQLEAVKLSGEELRRAKAALAGPNSSRDAEVTNASAAPGAASAPAHAPLPLKSADPTTRELALAAQRFARAAQRQPDDFEAVYNHGLALQELATRAGASRAEQLRLLAEACDCYEAAGRLREWSHAALYNCGVALSDMARAAGPGDAPAAAQYLLGAAAKYATSLKWNPNNPQALNNWGLVLSELAGMRPPGERGYLAAHSIAKFRRAIRLRPEFDRACYNLGTVVYAHAGALAAPGALSPQLSQDPGAAAAAAADEEASERMFRLAAQYIVLAFALQPGKEVYRRSLGVVSELLPRPALCAGALLAADPASAGTCHERWERCWFVADQDGFRSADRGAQGQPAQAPPRHKVALGEVAAVKAVHDPSLPDGHAFWVALASHPAGLYFVAETEEEAEGWVDALLLLAHLAAQACLPALRWALAHV
ncbi:hypothetical protein WJX81_003553 [Elliptochloris bilobata]|uniref:PH domain-containing protein n=1 Tax=Elliptochloris bilobata TaxID=381761 RepID=A0AAW1QYE7_9CHLO